MVCSLPLWFVPIVCVPWLISNLIGSVLYIFSNSHTYSACIMIQNTHSILHIINQEKALYSDSTVLQVRCTYYIQSNLYYADLNKA